MISQKDNLEQFLISEIERLELEARSARKRIEHATTEQDKRVLNRLLIDIHSEIKSLRDQLG